jgi:hypothetical protein
LLRIRWIGAVLLRWLGMLKRVLLCRLRGFSGCYGELRLMGYALVHLAFGNEQYF